MHIEKLAPDRWREFRSLRLEALLTEPNAFGASHDNTSRRPDDWWMACLQNAQVDPSRTILFATEQDQLVGLAGAYPEEDPKIVDIVMMYVKPSHRGQGIGFALLKAVAEEVAPREVRLCVYDDQTPAVDLYRRFGFVTLTETPKIRADGTEYSELYMVLKSESPGGTIREP